MKKFFSTCLGAIVLIMSLWVAVPVLAAPNATASMSVTEVISDGEDIIFTVSIAISKPSEAYASLDFNLVSSSHDNLTIANGTGSALAISFVANYGSAYHPGKEADNGGYSWLIGIFSQGSGNQISDATNICSVRLRYRGTAPQTLSIKDMTLNYLDSAGNVLSTVLSTDSVKLTIDRSLLSSEPTTTDTNPSTTPASTTPAGPSTTPPSPTGGGNDNSFPTVWMIIALIAIIALVAVAVLWLIQEKKRQR